MRYSYNFIEVIARWMSYGPDPEVLRDIKKIKIPDQFRLADQPIYRVMALNSINDYKPSIGSWTFSKTVIQDFISSHWFIDSFRTKEYAYMFHIKSPKKQNIILNIPAIFNDKIFRDSIKYYESQQKWFHEGLEIEDSQEELIYKADKNEFDSIYELQKNAKWKKIK